MPYIPSVAQVSSQVQWSTAPRVTHIDVGHVLQQQFPTHHVVPVGTHCNPPFSQVQPATAAWGLPCRGVHSPCPFTCQSTLAPLAMALSAATSPSGSLHALKRVSDSSASVARTPTNRLFTYFARIQRSRVSLQKNVGCIIDGRLGMGEIGI